ncbi:penicillin-binding protein 1C [Acidovorax sp. NCPPB 3576]|uniref:penicillin-binding protein 1C n=1 Tax=Acidovorax sp. NCPPB 3576 TaxID=2940488 RepID=UPI00234BAB47|nr:penicillin-binding protein 1C [Acidovorax sp. NCPPB 3576]WCM90911.1 penicillin-binding protein 1C [Acidovorax sp. NCPPB 3576]
MPSAWALPTFGEVRADFRPSDTLVLSREGEVLQRLRTDATVRRGQWVPLAEVSPALRTALVLSEDKRFYEHSGVDWRAVSAAAWGNLWNQRTRGASTLTMQLAGLLDGDWRQGAGGRSVVQKLGQTVAAQVLERRWRKDQVLEAYLNLVPFRGEIVGIDALSRTLFGKAAHGLDEREAAVAAALVRAPNARPALVAQRACGVLREMQKPVVPSCDALDLFTTAALQRRAFDGADGVAPHFARYLLRQPVAAESGDAAPQRRERVASTLSAPLQRFAVQTLHQHLRELQGRNVEDGAVVVLDNATGEVLAWVGSSGALSQAGEVDGVLAPRQPGSTLKPFLYAQAFAEQRLTAASLIEDSSAHIPTASGLYIPQNYDRQFKGWVSARTALAASLNVPAVRTLVMVSPDAFFRQLRALGLPLRESGDYFGYSLALGSAEVPLLHLANAYRALANGGRYGPVAVTPAQGGGAPRAAAAAPAMDPRAAFLVGDILSDGNARARTFGTDSVLATRFWTAVKTGTSKDMRDNWALGWSRRYTVGVWVGNASGAPMHDVSGTSGAAPVWAEIMGWLHRGGPGPGVRSRSPAPPEGMVQAAVRFGPEPGGARLIESARQEWFIAGTQQPLFAIDNVAEQPIKTAASGQNRPNPGPGATEDGLQAPAPRILSPAPGTIVALDPDIPPDRQRLQFAATSVQPKARSDLRWRIDGRVQGRGSQWAWLPWPGRHRVELLDGGGQVLDTISLEVRGAGLKK